MSYTRNLKLTGCMEDKLYSYVVQVLLTRYWTAPISESGCQLVILGQIAKKPAYIDFHFGTGQWYEKHARYQNLKDKLEMNELPSKNVSNTWLPLVQS